MPRTTLMRAQHDLAVALVGEIAALSLQPPSEPQAFQIVLKLAKLTGLLRIHFAQEDRLLYPALTAVDNSEASLTAIRFQAEMGDLSRRFEDFAQRWSASTVVLANFVEFRRESRTIFGALKHRIEQENAVLYPFADALDDPALVRIA
ncbi:hemerythrin domain-containing protein [Sphingomonas sp. GCM10030256]|uniref:hemerythrin domain-containing protein n=1 Tax=Sphingomonas sp. GCM10030256 TaxID=3273427 RepID=UPI0036081277